MISYLNTVSLGGYDKRETMDALESLNTRICLLCDELEKKKRGRVFDVPPWMPVRMPCRANRDGFDEKDTDQLITELRSCAAELENELLK
jgi:hypothetical protein